MQFVSSIQRPLVINNIDKLIEFIKQEMYATFTEAVGGDVVYAQAKFLDFRMAGPANFNYLPSFTFSGRFQRTDLVLEKQKCFSQVNFTVFPEFRSESEYALVLSMAVYHANQGEPCYTHVRDLIVDQDPLTWDVSDIAEYTWGYIKQKCYGMTGMMASAARDFSLILPGYNEFNSTFRGDVYQAFKRRRESALDKPDYEKYAFYIFAMNQGEFDNVDKLLFSVQLSDGVVLATSEVNVVHAQDKVTISVKHPQGDSFFTFEEALALPLAEPSRWGGVPVEHERALRSNRVIGAKVAHMVAEHLADAASADEVSKWNKLVPYKTHPSAPIPKVGAYEGFEDGLSLAIRRRMMPYVESDDKRSISKHQYIALSNSSLVSEPSVCEIYLYSLHRLATSEKAHRSGYEEIATVKLIVLFKEGRFDWNAELYRYDPSSGERVLNTRAVIDPSLSDAVSVDQHNRTTMNVGNIANVITTHFKESIKAFENEDFHEQKETQQEPAQR